MTGFFKALHTLVKALNCYCLSLATWCKEPAHWKRSWCWERLRAGGEAHDRRWDGWMASLTQTWVWASSGSWWWTGNGNPFQCSCTENPMDGGAWWAAVHGVASSWARLNDFTFTFLRWRRKWQSTPVFLLGESQGRRSFPLWGRTESDTTEVT